MKKSIVTVDLSGEFVLGIAINTEEVQIAIVFFILTIKFTQK